MSDGLDDFERRLAAADFSAESRVRQSLRARLVARGAARRSRSPALVLAFATAAVLLALPLRELLRAPRPTAYPRGPEGFPILPGAFAASGGSAERLFDAIPGTPFETRPVTIDDIFERRAKAD